MTLIMRYQHKSLQMKGNIANQDEAVKVLFCVEKYKTLTASSFETGLYSVKLCEALNTTDEKEENF